MKAAPTRAAMALYAASEPPRSRTTRRHMNDRPAFSTFDIASQAR
jgi:hypothetical protein